LSIAFHTLENFCEDAQKKERPKPLLRVSRKAQTVKTVLGGLGFLFFHKVSNQKGMQTAKTRKKLAAQGF